MASLPTIKQISREDMREAPDWIERLLTPLNQFMGSVYSALSGQLTFQQNIRASIRELRVDTPADYTTGGFPEISFDTGISAKAVSVQIAWLRETDATDPLILGAPVPMWTERGGKIFIRYISGLENSTKYLVRFVVY